MVRFIIFLRDTEIICLTIIYIPIWLDLLYCCPSCYYITVQNLHSNMVRFIMSSFTLQKSLFIAFTFQYGQIYYYDKYMDEGTMNEFTFQYGQIYYTNSAPVIGCIPRIYIPIWLDLLFQLLPNPMLHFTKFTFQYGQIYYCPIVQIVFCFYIIYIPIWLDLLFFVAFLVDREFAHLHSNMVRFIIGVPGIIMLSNLLFTFQYGQIYYSFVVIT